MKKTLTISFSVLILLLIFIYIITPTSTLFRYMISSERSFAGLELERITVDELEIEYLRGGSGPPLVLLHGFGADKDNWNRISGYLVEHFDVIAIDLPGFGNSTRDIELDYDVFSQVARFKQITDALNLVEFNLAGSSMGGYIAGNFAAQYPSKVENLWLISPFGVVNSETSEMFAATQKGQNPVVLPRTEADFLELFDFLFVKPPFIPSPVIQHLALKAKERVKLNTKIFDQIHRMNNGEPQPDSPLDSVLKSYNGSVLISWGEKDRVLHVSGASALKQIIPHAKIEIIKNVGHLPMVEAPSAIAESFLSFAGVS
ncbi:alpha/beta fold hydrolase [Moritella viscosa]|uniref:alpha/beta fold hydrolase n=1 Tax=Moritella viscosa TaxID=80854 RepID=UPI00091E4111|nr:alpha/beta hydrolase [Moritella viscosa]SGZ05516.1 Triacylglycerol acyl hydrolase [Moritella viscosa]